MLSSLQLHQNNHGLFTGTESFPGEESLISSYSPVDGKLIGTTHTVSKKQYEKTFKKKQSAIYKCSSSLDCLLTI